MKSASNHCKRILTSRRGVSMVEVIVALAVIAIVSASALTLVLSHARLESKTVQTKEATNIAENIIECFRYADSPDEFKTAISEAGIKFTGSIDSSETDFPEYEVKYNGSTYLVSLCFTNDENELFFIDDENALFKAGTTIKIQVGTASNEDILGDVITYTKYI